MADTWLEKLGIITTEDLNKWEHEREYRYGKWCVKWGFQLKGGEAPTTISFESEYTLTKARNDAAEGMFREAMYMLRNPPITPESEIFNYIEPIPKSDDESDDKPESTDRIGVLLSCCDGNDAIIFPDSVNGIHGMNGGSGIIFSGVTVGVRGTVIEVARKLGIYVEDARDMPGDAESENRKGEVAE